MLGVGIADLIHLILAIIYARFVRTNAHLSIASTAFYMWTSHGNRAISHEASLDSPVQTKDKRSSLLLGVHGVPSLSPKQPWQISLVLPKVVGSKALIVLCSSSSFELMERVFGSRTPFAGEGIYAKTKTHHCGGAAGPFPRMQVRAASLSLFRDMGRKSPRLTCHVNEQELYVCPVKLQIVMIRLYLFVFR